MGKPQFPMHGLHYRQSIRQVVTAIVLSLAATCTVYVFYNLPKQEKYRNFYTTYDPMKSFNRMREGGYLDSCPPISKGKGSKKEQH